MAQRPLGIARMAPIDYLAPETEQEALAALAEAPAGSVAVLAGGTDLLLDLEEGRLRPRRLLSLRRLPWKTHRWDRDRLELGATEPLRRLERDPLLASRCPALADAIAAVGSPALRRQATIGGNLGRGAPASDLAPVLLALDAEVELVGPGGARRLAIDDFLAGPRRTALRAGELVRSVRLPEPRPTSAYLWQRVRPANDISQIGVALAFSPTLGAWRVSLGGVPPRPVLVTEAARALHGSRPAPPEVREASERLASASALVSDRRATEEHRRRLASVLCTRGVAIALDRPSGAS
jgi:CO/xanthine dehydrogenase FAD-binding subunit